VWNKAGYVFEQWEDGTMVRISVTSMNVYISALFLHLCFLFRNIFCVEPIPMQGVYQ